MPSIFICNTNRKLAVVSLPPLFFPPTQVNKHPSGASPLYFQGTELWPVSVNLPL